METKAKIDKRTKAYKESVKSHDTLRGINYAVPAPPPTEPYPTSAEGGFNENDSLKQPSPLKQVPGRVIIDLPEDHSGEVAVMTGKGLTGTTQIPVTISGTIPISPANSFPREPRVEPIQQVADGEGMIPVAERTPSPPPQSHEDFIKEMRAKEEEYLKTHPKLDYSKIENNPGFKLCGKCGGDTLELNEDGSSKSRRQPEMCRDCVWENENKIKCEDGVIRDKAACKRITRMVAGDEVYAWVKK